MPIYEYLCEKCGHEFEREQRITENPVRTCPECRARKVKRLISQTSFALKGSGWYSDLYSSGKPKKDAAEKSDSKPGGDAAAPSKADAPSDAKAKPKPKAETGSSRARAKDAA